MGNSSIHENNLYFNNAVPSLHEPDAKVYSGTALEVKVLASQNKVSVRIIDPELLKTEKVAGIVSSDLGKVTMLRCCMKIRMAVRFALILISMEMREK